MNPYNFIPLPKDAPVRKKPEPHDRFVGYAGNFSITLKAVSPMIICSGKEQDKGQGKERGKQQGFPLQGRRNGKDYYFIPGTSVKGMLRNVYETIEGGCLRLTQSTNLRTSHEREYGACEKNDYLCPACRIFGMMHKSGVHRGYICPGDLIGPEVRPIRGETKLEITVGRPKPAHESFYRKEGELRGRKGYYHQEKPSQGTLMPKSIYPLPAGTLFQGTVSFTNLTIREVALLYYCLGLEAGLAHKIGFGKAAGLGSAIITLHSIKVADVGKRQGLKINWLDSLPSECEAILKELKKRTDPTWQAFREIYNLTNIQGKKYHYPSFDWFKKNSQKSLEEFNQNSES